MYLNLRSEGNPHFAEKDPASTSLPLSKRLARWVRLLPAVSAPAREAAPGGGAYSPGEATRTICFVTDQRPDEKDILSPLKQSELEVRDLDGYLIRSLPAPEQGWSHAALDSLARELAPWTYRGAEAYLGGEWVGSTEV